MSMASSSMRSVIISKALRRISPRWRGGCLAHSAWALLAASSAARASSGCASATSHRLSPVEGSSTASVSPPTASRHSPPMYSCFLTPSITDCSDAWVSMPLPSPFWIPQIPRSRPPWLLACPQAGRDYHHNAAFYAPLLTSIAHYTRALFLQPTAHAERPAHTGRFEFWTKLRRQAATLLLASCLYQLAECPIVLAPAYLAKAFS